MTPGGPGIAVAAERFKGRVAAATGMTSGIGRGIVSRPAAEGAHLCGLGREPGGIGEHIHRDVADAASVAQAADNLLASDAVIGVNLRGVFPVAAIEEIAAGTLHLFSDEADYGHGTDLLIDGGYSLR